MADDNDGYESIEFKEGLLDAIKQDENESCEKILGEVKVKMINEEDFWESVERHVNEPIFYFAVAAQAWKIVDFLISNLSQNQFRPFHKKDVELQPDQSKKLLSYEEKLQESLMLLFKRNEISLLEKCLHYVNNLETLKWLISSTTDELGNLLIHVAARNNLTEFFKYVLPHSNLKETNLMGETALHLAAEGGSLETVRILMNGYERDSKSVVYVKDVQENTPLHSAVKTRHPKLEIVSLLVKAYENQLKPAVNRLGRSPLHVAAIHMSSTRNDCINIIQELRAFDPNAGDFEEETALHIAVKKRNFAMLEAMLEVFYGLHKDVFRHNKDKNGYSLLDICAMNANSKMVSLLLDYGADPRDGVLYHLISESVRVPEKSNELVKIYRTIVDQAEKWSRFRSEFAKDVKSVLKMVATIGSSIGVDFKKHTSDNVINLINHDGWKNMNRSAIEYAVDEGAVEMLEAFLQTEQLYEQVKKEEMRCECYRFNVQNCVKLNDNWICKKKIGTNKRALIDRIASHDDKTVAGRMFNIEPIRTMVMDHIKFAQLFYGLLTFAQIIYMAFFTIYHIPNVCRFEVGRGGKFNECTKSDSYYQNQFSKKFASKSTTCAYIIWPMLLLAFAILFNVKSTIHQSKWTEWLDIWKYSFPVFVIAWLCIFQYPNAKYDSHVACTALVFIIGWLYVFYLLSFFERFNIFASLLKTIILKDFVNFVVLMAIILLGFSCAIITLYQTPIPGTYSYRSLTGTAYRAFFETLSPGSTFLNETTDTNFQSLGGKLHLLRIAVVTYEILTCVILLNILIAMMSDTYNKEIASAKSLARLSLITNGINVRGLWPFGREVNCVVYLEADLVESIIRPKNLSEQRINIWQRFRDHVKPHMQVQPQNRTVLYD